MYLLVLSFIYCVTYLILFFGISLFFNNSFARLRSRSAFSLSLILLIYFGVVFGSELISDPEWSNRILHALGGGFLIVLSAFLAIKDGGIKINVFQFLIVGMSIAALFGIANEILEFILQNRYGFIFADSINDTWLDLVSNTVGSLLASVCLAVFLGSSRKSAYDESK